MPLCLFGQCISESLSERFAFTCAITVTADTRQRFFFSQRKCCNKSLQPHKLPEPAAQNVSLQDRRLLIEKASDMLKQCSVIR